MATSGEDEYSDESSAEQSDENIELSIEKIAEGSVEQLTSRFRTTLNVSTDSSDTIPNKLSGWWKDVSNITKDRKTDQVQYFYHCTSPENKKTIQQQKKLVGQSATIGPLSTDPNIKGVFFTTSLYKGSLPDKSPYGPDRILVPFSAIDINQWSLYFEMVYYTTRSHGYRNQFLRLVLVKNTDTLSKQWCNENLLPIDPRDNCLLHWTSTGVSNIDIYTYQTKLNIYTILFVVGDVASDVQGVEWDNVTSQSKKPSKLNATPGVYNKS